MKASSCGFHNGWIDRIDFADKADIQHFSRIFSIRHHHFAGTNQATVFTSQTTA
jgi:hypothetical protein